jgi:antitoxin component HigA of HigAB toxin-antitoxin module
MKKLHQLTREKDYEEALNQIEELWDVKDDAETEIYMDHLVALVEIYENIYYPID